MLLQYPVQFHLFRDHGRLNPEVSLEETGDCGANALFLLGLIEEEEATALSILQNICWTTKRGKESTPRYVFKKYLFTDDSKQYEVIQCTKEELMAEVQQLNPGYGTFLFMKDNKTKLGHSTCIYKNEETYEIELADLQTEEIIKNENYDPTRLDDYLSQYDLFYIPSTVRHSIVDSPVRRSQSKQTSESSLMYSHGSPAKTIPSPLRHDSENVDGYRSPEKVTRSPAKTVRSPLSPLRDPNRNRIGGKRKRTRRKN